MDLRIMQSIYTFPTLIIFAEGKGIATAKALIEATSDANGLDLYFRQEVRLYYRVNCIDWHNEAWILLFSFIQKGSALCNKPPVWQQDYLVASCTASPQHLMNAVRIINGKI